MGWWQKLVGRGATPEPEKRPERAKWRAADDPGNPFAVPLLDLMVLQSFLATSANPDVASKAVSWGGSTGAELDPRPVLDLAPLEGSLRFPVARDLPDGLLYRPPSMDEKWVLAWREGRVLAARSWTGVVEAVADGRREGDDLVLERLRVLESSGLRLWGPVLDTFDWLVRCHALGQRLPLPVDDAAANLLEQAPLSGFSPFGKVLFCAAKSWDPPAPAHPLRADGAVLVAARLGDVGALLRALASGAALDAPGTSDGYTALHVAVARGDLAMVDAALTHGASVTARADRGQHVLGLAVVTRAPQAILEALARTALDWNAVNADGFGALHAAAEVNHADVVPWLVGHGVALEARTRHGHTALHVAAGLGHVEVAHALLRAGADPRADSPGGAPIDVARAEGKAAVVALLTAAPGREG